jgi:hypothetical protein
MTTPLSRLSSVLGTRLTTIGGESASRVDAQRRLL